MSYTGIRGYYLLTQAIKNALLGDINVNTVTEGDLFDVDLSNSAHELSKASPSIYGSTINIELVDSTI